MKESEAIILITDIPIADLSNRLSEAGLSVIPLMEQVGHLVLAEDNPITEERRQEIIEQFQLDQERQ